MLAERSRHYLGKHTNLNFLKVQVEEYLEAEGFILARSQQGPYGWMIQAQGGGLLERVLPTYRSFVVHIEGEPDEFWVRIGIERRALTSPETLLLVSLYSFYVMDVIQGFGVERGLLKQVDAYVG
jgi:hypothetical protein